MVSASPHSLLPRGIWVNDWASQIFYHLKLKLNQERRVELAPCARFPDVIDTASCCTFHLSIGKSRTSMDSGLVSTFHIELLIWTMSSDLHSAGSYYALFIFKVFMYNSTTGYRRGVRVWEIFLSAFLKYFFGIPDSYLYGYYNLEALKVAELHCMQKSACWMKWSKRFDFHFLKL